MGKWKFFFANSSDLEINRDITSNARNKQLTLSHNRSGNCSFQLPLSTDNLNYGKPNEHCIIAMKNNEIVWSGPIWTRSIDLQNEKIDISAVGWFEILMNRFLESTLDYSAGVNDGGIASGLLKVANTDHPTYIAFGANGGTNTRYLKYEVFQSIGEEIINLSDMEGGFDIYLDPVTRELNILDSADYVARTEIPFGMNFGVNNVSNIVIEENGGEMRNRIQVVGSDNTVYSYNADGTGGTPDSQGINNLMTEVIQLTETADHTVLQAVANATGQIKQFGMISYDIQLKPQGVNNPYELFEDYNIGDRIYFTAQKQVDGELLVIENNPRVFGATIDIDENGVERVSSLQTTFSGS